MDENFYRSNRREGASVQAGGEGAGVKPEEEEEEEERPLRWSAHLDGRGHYLPRAKAFQGVWTLTLTFAEIGEGLYPTRLELERGLSQGPLPPGGITARLLHRIPLGALTDAFRRERHEDDAFHELIYRRPRFSHQLPPKDNRAGPPGLGEVFYQDVASAYLRALVSHPHAPIEAMLPSYPKATKANVRDWVARARGKGYLTSLGRGRAGGEPTPKLRDALAARGPDASGLDTPSGLAQAAP